MSHKLIKLINKNNKNQKIISLKIFAENDSIILILNKRSIIQSIDHFAKHLLMIYFDGNYICLFYSKQMSMEKVNKLWLLTN